VRKITFGELTLPYLPGDGGAPLRRRHNLEDAVMKARFSGSRTAVNRAGLALAVSLMLAQAATSPARADIATPEQKKACTPDVYRLCAGEIPNVRAITACLRRQKANLSEACRAVFEQRGN
jgi:hypothetical protein